MEKWNMKTACVAGANSGIGAALTKYFLECNMKVIGIDKNVDKLNEMKQDEENSENLTIIKVDVTKDNEFSKAIEDISKCSKEINVVTYSMGCIGKTTLIDGDYGEWEKLINVNVVGFCSFMKEMINLMLKQNVQDGRIIIMNSIVVLESAVFADLHFYAATKCAIDALLQGFQYEVKEKKGSIKFTNLYAGLVKTDMYKNSLGPNHDISFFKTVISLGVNDITESVDYILRTPANVKINRMVVCPRGIFKQNLLNL